MLIFLLIVRLKWSVRNPSIRFRQGINDKIDKIFNFFILQSVLSIDGLFVRVSADGVIHSGVSTPAPLDVPPLKIDTPRISIVSTRNLLTNSVAIFVPADCVILAFIVGKANVVQFAEERNPLRYTLP